MACTGNEGGPISNTDAETWINEFKEQYPNDVYAHLFGKNKLANVISQTGCVGIRIYNAIEPSTGNKKLIIYGVDQNGDGLTGYILEYGSPCPPSCGRP
ncbi:MAG TPA: hypothetical protein VD905_07200 [Flavobacteriales bacterium]|nr:hypothetical protein [Flavobacteriales bacterium]